MNYLSMGGGGNLDKSHLNDMESFPGNIKSSLKFTYSML